MQNKCIGHCRYCGSVIEYEQEGSWIRCTSCGETLAVTGFINEQIRFRQMKEKAEKTEEALKTAETEKTEAQQRLLDTLSQLETISQNQGDQRMQLDNLLTEQQYTKDEEKAIRSLLETMQGDAAENQKKMSDFLLAVMKGQQTAGEKLEALQAVSGQMIQSCGDIASLISGVEQYIRTDTEEKNRQINNLQNWAQEAREEDLNLLRNIQSDCRVLQNGLEAIDEKIARIEDSTKEVQKAVNDFHHQWEQSLRDNIINTYHLAESLQKNQSFEQAEEFYRNVLIIGGDDPEVYWRMILCHYCVEYQKKDNEDKYVPTILYPELSDPRNRSEWANLQKNLHNDEQRKYYEEQLRPIEDILRKYGQLQHQVKYDVFISVKQEENGRLTKDSDTGSLLYDKISGMGYRVFNSRRSLQAGQDFEPYIIASLLSARLMIVIGSTKEHLEAPWVKNEWTRFRWLQQKEIKQNGKTDRILVPYLTGGMKPEDLPGDLQYIQAIPDGVCAGDQLNEVLKNIPVSQKTIQGRGNSYKKLFNLIQKMVGGGVVDELSWKLIKGNKADDSDIEYYE